MNAQDPISTMGLVQRPHRHDLLQGGRPTGRHAASRASTHNRSSSHQQQDIVRSLQPPERLLPRDHQLPLPPSSPGLHGSDNTLVHAASGYSLPVPGSSRPHASPVEQHQCRQHSTSDAGQVHAYTHQGYSRGLPFVHQQHPQQQPWSGHAPSALVQPAAIPEEVQHPQQQQRSPILYVQLPRPPLNPRPEATPPLPPGPPPAAPESAPSHMQQVAAGNGNRDDSSDSSSSQLASSQRHSTRVLPGNLDRGRVGLPIQAARLNANIAVARASYDLQQQVASGQDSGRVAGALPRMTKQQAADAVKALIKPLYVVKALSKDQFKAVAQTCTHALADIEGHLGDNTGVHDMVHDCLVGIGLSEAAAQL